MSTIIDGKKISAEIRQEVVSEVNVLKQKGIVPHLAVIIVGSDPGSHVYVRNKHKACEETGIRSTVVEMAEDITQEQLLAQVEKLNQDKSVHGILVQSPVPKGLSEEKAFESIHPLKDVDCFNPENVGLMMLGRPRFMPATPAGVIELLVRYNVPLSGKHVVIIGRSNIVGKPLANMLSQKNARGNATVTICHTGTRELDCYTRQADIVIAAAGSPKMITSEMLKNNCAVIDVGTNRIQDPSTKSGYRLVGDVDFESASKVAAYISPVPGGVGPMTISMLLKNCITAAKLQN